MRETVQSKQKYGPEYQGYDVPHGTQQVDTVCLRRITGSSEIHTMTRNALPPLIHPSRDLHEGPTIG